MNRSGVRFPQVAPCDESRHGLHLSRVIGYRSPRPSAGVFLLVVPVVAVGVDGVAPDQNLIRAEGVPIWAARRRAGDPLAVRRLHQLIQHNYKPVPRPARASMANSAGVARSPQVGVRTPWAGLPSGWGGPSEPGSWSVLSLSSPPLESRIAQQSVTYFPRRCHYVLGLTRRPIRR